MKKLVSMIVLAAFCLGTVSAAIPAKAVSDTTVTKMKVKKKRSKMKVKKTTRDTTKKM